MLEDLLERIKWVRPAILMLGFIVLMFIVMPYLMSLASPGQLYNFKKVFAIVILSIFIIIIGYFIYLGIEKIVKYIKSVYKESIK